MPYIAAQLVRQKEVDAAITAVLELLPDAGDPRQAALLAAFGLFIASNVLVRLGAPVPQHFDLRKEQPMLAETMERWRRDAMEAIAVSE